MIWKAVFISLFQNLTYVLSILTWKHDLDLVMKITSLILSPDFQIYVTQGYGAQLYYVDGYKLKWICSGAQPGIYYRSRGLGEEKAQYMQGIIAASYLWYIIPWYLWQRRITIWLLWLKYWCLFRYIFI